MSIQEEVNVYVVLYNGRIMGVGDTEELALSGVSQILTNMGFTADDESLLTWSNSSGTHVTLVVETRVVNQEEGL